MTPTIEVSAGASVNPASGKAQNFTNPVVYTVTAEDGSTTNYTVTVVVGKRTEKAILSFIFKDFNPEIIGTVDELAKTVTATVPFNTSLTSLKPTIVISTNASISPASNAAQDFTNPVTYTVTAEDGSVQQYIVTVSRASFSTRIDAVSSKSIAVGDSITLTGYFAETGNKVEISLDSVNFIPLTIGTESVSTITAAIPENINTGNYTIYVTSNGTKVSYKERIEVKNPKQPSITSTNKTTYIKGIDTSMIITGTNLKPETGKPVVTLIDAGVNTSITDNNIVVSDNGTQITATFPTNLTPKKYLVRVEVGSLTSKTVEIELVNQ